ncbi:DUF3727 domain-containing protein [Microcoleus sp. FACHB-672]|uniref:DUF3727 domain-containing protein n=1 Tax=Microcoleus sp. FACHB-672 TaxID=2692825 RepID=UPI001687ED08|nr:DUF3727 domain-containing protein [Microcoleus sp. FACHB-672]MBD2039299.1 DUF3727 domain-containing protein [Microcoleus sp. FACHB-672]
MTKSQSPKENGRPSSDTVTLTDESGRTLTCSIEHSLELEGQEYVLLLPIDSPVEIFAWQAEGDDEEAVPIEDEDVDPLFSIAKAVLEEQNLTLKRTAITLTVEGDLPDLSSEDIGEDEDTEEGDYEELQWLASFYHEELEYAIYTPLDPFFVLARINDDGEPELLSPEEFQKLEPMLPALEGLIEDRLFDEELEE